MTDFVETLKKMGPPARLKIISAGLFLFLLAMGGVIQYSLWRDVFDARAQLAMQHRSEMRLAMAAQKMREAIANSQKKPALQAHHVYLSGESDAIAASAFQTMILDILKKNAAHVYSIDVHVRMGEQDGLDGAPIKPQAKPVDLKVSFDATTVGLQKILFRIETGWPVMIIDSLHVAKADVSANNTLLHVALWVHGYTAGS